MKEGVLINLFFNVSNMKYFTNMTKGCTLTKISYRIFNFFLIENILWKHIKLWPAFL